MVILTLSFLHILTTLGAGFLEPFEAFEALREDLRRDTLRFFPNPNKPSIFLFVIITLEINFTIN